MQEVVQEMNLCTFEKLSLFSSIRIMNRMKNILLICVMLLGTWSAIGQDKNTLVHAIGYYQSLKFEESLNVFNVLIEREPENASLIGRRGYVRCQYIKAIDQKKIPAITPERYAEVVREGIEDLKVGLEEKPENTDNANCLKYLQSRL